MKLPPTLPPAPCAAPAAHFEIWSLYFANGPSSTDEMPLVTQPPAAPVPPLAASSTKVSTAACSAACFFGSETLFLTQSSRSFLVASAPLLPSSLIASLSLSLSASTTCDG